MAKGFVEIERRFLCRLDDPTALDAAPRERLVQGYLTEQEPSVRIRSFGGARWVLTVKTGRGRVRQEIEIPVEPDAAEALMELAGTHRLEKLRHRLGPWDVDLHQGNLEGLVTAEIELATEDEPLPAPPAGVTLVREVTELGRFTARALSALEPEEARRLVASALAELPEVPGDGEG